MSANNNKQLEVKIIKAVNLPLTPDETQPTAFVRISSNINIVEEDGHHTEQVDEKRDTSVSDGKNCHPFWKETFVFSGLPTNNIVKFEVFNQDLFEGEVSLCSGTYNFDASKTSSSEEIEISLDNTSNGKLFINISAKNPAESQHLLAEKPMRKSPAASTRGSPVAAVRKNENDNNGFTNNKQQKDELAEFPPAKRESLIKCFNIFDVDGNGTLSQSESLAAFLTFFPSLSASKLRKKIQEADTNQDGNLDLNEFAKIAIQFV